MKYISSYYRGEECGQASPGKESGALCGRASIVLQQVRCGNLPVFFAWVCGEKAAEDSAGAYMTGRLLDWFYKKITGLCRRGSWREMKAAEKSLTGEVEEIERELALWNAGKEDGEKGELTLAAGILCMGRSFLLYSKGQQRIYALNTRFLRPNLRLLSGESGQWQVKRGVLQSGIGILLGTESFYQGLTEEMVRECLEVGALSDELRVEKRLKELGEAVRINGNMEGKGAVLFCVK